jgi:hypothetical protein
MAAMPPLHVPADGWTVDDAPDLEVRCEIVDGALLVTPPEPPRNLRATARLHLLLAPVVEPSWEVLLGAGITFDARNLRIPDLLVAAGRPSTRVASDRTMSCSPSRS